MAVQKQNKKLFFYEIAIAQKPFLSGLFGSRLLLLKLNIYDTSAIASESHLKLRVEVVYHVVLNVLHRSEVFCDCSWS